MADCHNVYIAVNGEALAGSNGTITSEWFDTSHWDEMAVAWEADDSQSLDYDISLHVSSQGYYELNNKTATTEDYSTVAVVANSTAKVYTRKDGSDVDDFLRPLRSARVYVYNNSNAADSVTVWLEGWSDVV